MTASIEYRLSNSAHFPAPVEDAKKAIRYLRAHADEYGIDPAKVVIGGEYYRRETSRAPGRR